MSRSVKKVPIIKDKNRFAQKLGNRKFRAVNKMRLKHGKEELLLNDKSEVIDDYDVSDWKVRFKKVKK